MINNNTILNDKKVIPLYEGGVSHNFSNSDITGDTIFDDMGAQGSALVSCNVSPGLDEERSSESNGILLGNISCTISPLFCNEGGEEQDIDEDEISNILANQENLSSNYPYLVSGWGVDCGRHEWLGFKRCKDGCGTYQHFYDKCFNIHCPSHSQLAVNRQSKTVLNRLKGYYDLKDRYQKLPRHIVFSPDEWQGLVEPEPSELIHEWETWCNYKGENKKFRGYELKKLSGVYVLHLYRVKGWDKKALDNGDIPEELYYSEQNIKRRLREYKEKNNDYRGFWELIKHDILGLGSHLSYVYCSPHIHFLGYGRLSSSAEMKEKYGIVYKNLGERSFDFTPNKHSFGYTNQVLGTLKYIGSHAVIEPGCKRPRLFRYVGLCTHRKMKKTEETTTETHKEVCFNCGRDNVVMGQKNSIIHRLVGDELRNADDNEYLGIDCGIYSDDKGNKFSCITKPSIFKFTWNKYCFVIHNEDVEKNLKRCQKKGIEIKIESLGNEEEYCAIHDSKEMIEEMRWECLKEGDLDQFQYYSNILMYGVEYANRWKNSLKSVDKGVV